MLRKIFTQQVHPTTPGRPRAWQWDVVKFLTLLLLLGGLGSFQQAWGQRFRNDSLTVVASPTGTGATTTLYYGRTGTPQFGGQLATDIDPFNANGTLTITSAGANLNPAGTTVTEVSMFYRVYNPTTTTAPSYTQAPLSLSTTSGSSSTKQVYGTTQAIDLLAVPRAQGGGTYNVDIYFAFKWSDAGDVGEVADPSNGYSSPYHATFTVKAPTVTPTGATTTWTGAVSQDWADPKNWNNGVPSATSNAVIPEKGPAIPRYPSLDDAAYTYAVNNLTLQGTTSSSRAEVNINAATLKIYGDLQQAAGGLTGSTKNAPGVTDATKNSTVVFAGANQIITGNLVVSDIVIAGSGTKSVMNQLTPSNILAFEPASAANGVILQSASANSSGGVDPLFDTTGNSFIELGGSAQISAVAGQAETTTSYIKGVVRATRNLQAGVFNSFGNIGLDMTPNHSANGIFVYRVVGDPLQSPRPNATNPPVPVKRQFKITGDDDSNNNNTPNSKVSVRFHYLPSTTPDKGELNGIEEQNLTMFETLANGGTYTPTGGTLYMAQRVFERLDLPTYNNYTLTLGDRTNPLPVTLVAFGASRSGANALLSWTTASEKNNSGFNVQVATDGATFRTLGFVASKSPNSSTKLNYTYTDTEEGKIGARYYRLEQVDADGTKSYSPVRVVNFSGAAAGPDALAAYPNPFTDNLTLIIDGANVTDGTATVKVVDMAGRTVRESKLPLVGATLALGDVSSLPSGLYLAKVTLPNGTTQTVRISKQ